jgi:hypothetical protein
MAEESHGGYQDGENGNSDGNRDHQRTITMIRMTAVSFDLMHVFFSPYEVAI